MAMDFGENTAAENDNLDQAFESNFGDEAEQQISEKKNNKIWLIVAVVLIVLCCCCVVVGGAVWWLWENGDDIFNLTMQLSQLPV